MKEKREHVQRVAQQAFEECLKALRRKTSPVDVGRGWRPDLRCSFDQRHSVSHGSASRVFLALQNYVEDDNRVFSYREYASLKNEPALGPFLTGNWQHAVRALVAHECAHAGQFQARNVEQVPTVNWRREFSKVHGTGWRRIYAYLRKELGVNRDIRSVGGFLGQKEIDAAIADWTSALPFVRGGCDSSGTRHLLWAREQRLKISSRVYRVEDEQLCCKKLNWNLTPPEPQIAGLCWDCFILAVSIGRAAQLQRAI